MPPKNDNAHLRKQLGVVGITSRQNRHRNDSAATPPALLQPPVDDTGLPPWRLARHAAALVDAALALICTGRPVSIMGRKVLADLADRLRQLAEVLR